MITTMIIKTLTITTRFTFARAFLAASASAAIALINCSGTRTSFTCKIQFKSRG